MKKAGNNLMIRNSTAEFLMFTSDLRGAGGESIQVRYEDKMIWLTQKLMALLFDVDVKTVNWHQQNIFSETKALSDNYFVLSDFFSENQNEK